MKFTIFGAGSWGTAIAIHTHRLGLNTTLVPRRSEHTDQISANSENADYLPGYSTNGIHVTTNIAQALKNTDVALLACPSKALRGLCSSIKEHLPTNPPILLALCKGLEQDSLLPPVQVIQAILPNAPAGVLSGPTFAGEVAAGKPTAITLSLTDPTKAKDIQEALSSDSLRVYTSGDLLGVEFASCLKNVYAIGAGLCDGLNLGDNAKAAYLSRAMAELTRIGIALGGQPQTFYGLSGFGDLVATCFGAQSRNRTFGQTLAQGKSPLDIINSQKTVVEGYWATNAFHNLLPKHNLDAPILDQLYQVQYKDLSPKTALQNLMSRKLKSEA